LISAEFLEALPPDIRAEIIQQESMERTRRRTDETTPRLPVGEPAEIDAASFIASLDPSLRQAVLLDQDDTFLQTLPPHMLAEVDVYRDELQARRSHNSRNPARPIPTVPSVKKYAQHDAIMLLDRAGVAILARLLFYPQVLKKSLLFKVLVNLCENLKTRTELFNLLLSILQDGTGDLMAVDKSFAQMTVKTRESKPQTPKAKQKPSDFVPPFGMQVSQMEAVPDLIAQRCLEALTYIVNANETSSLFFLMEQEMSAGLRKLSAKKGKGKEKQISQSHYPLVLLLNLLDRQALLRTPSILESVVGLLATITRPLTNLKEPSKMEDNVMQPPLTAQEDANTDDNHSRPSALPEATDSSTGETAPPGGRTDFVSS
jgi:E3 ubiquitin-protein ligase HUWE1